MAVSFCQFNLLSDPIEIAPLLHFNPALNEIDQIVTLPPYAQSWQWT